MAAIIYANTMSFEAGCSIDDFLDVAARWLNSHTGGRLNSADLKMNNDIPFSARQRVQTWVSDDAFPQAHAFRYSHPDKDTLGRPVYGRQWITEVGFRCEHEDSEIECTVLLRTEDDSPNSNVPGVSRPKLVLDLSRLCPLAPDVAGLSLTHPTIMNEGVMEGLRYFVINNSERRRPLVIVSPTTSSDYLVDTKHLSDLLVGLASVIVIPLGFNTYKMQEVVGDQYTPYNGAVSIIFPNREVRGSRVVPSKKLMPDELLVAPLNKREVVILEAVTRRTNSSSFSRHISPEMVSELDFRRRIAKRKEEVAEQGAQSKELDDLWAEFDKLDQEKQEVDAKLAKSEDDNVYLNLLLDEAQQNKSEQERHLTHQIKVANDRLSDLTASKTVLADEGLPQFREAFAKVMNKRAVPEDYFRTCFKTCGLILC